MQMNMGLNHNHVTTSTQPVNPGLQILDYLGDMSRVEFEEEAIQRIVQMYRFIFPAQEVIYVALQGDLIIAVEPADTPPDIPLSLVQQSKSTNPGLPSRGILASYIYPVTSLCGTLGIVALLKKTSKPLDPRNIDLGRMAALYSGVVVSNIRSMQKLHEDEKLLHKQANADAKTGLSSRRYFFEIAEAEFKRSKRYDRPLSAILVDIDNFKGLTKEHGRDTGERIIHELSCIFTKELRDSDIRVRLGGEELLVLLPETNVRFAQSLAERLRNRVAEHTVTIGEGSVNITISLGVVGLTRQVKSLEEFISNGDQALHQARHTGGDQVSTWGETAPEYQTVIIMRESDHRIGFY
jgi:diguanylate cyclase (GGDEF)-like protein